MRFYEPDMLRAPATLFVQRDREFRLRMWTARLARKRGLLPRRAAAITATDATTSPTNIATANEPAGTTSVATYSASALRPATGASGAPAWSASYASRASSINTAVCTPIAAASPTYAPHDVSKHR